MATKTTHNTSTEEDDRIVIAGGRIKPAFKPSPAVIWRPSSTSAPKPVAKKGPVLHEIAQKRLEHEVEAGGGYMGRKDRRKRRKALMRELTAEHFMTTGLHYQGR